jgi:uncharacterized protein
MIFLTIFFLAILISYPIWDYFFIKKIKRVGIGKWKLYRTTVLSQWGLVFILLVFWVITERTISDLFFFSQPFYDSEALSNFLLGLATSLTILILAFIFSKSIRNKLAELFIEDSIAFLLPKTKQERFLFLGVSLTAGICEEIIFRGAFVYYLNALPLELSVLVVGVISSIVFGLVHLYQGWKGVLGTAILGFGLYFLFARTGNLLVPILIHFLIDAKFVFLPNEESKLK